MADTYPRSLAVSRRPIAHSQEIIFNPRSLWPSVFGRVATACTQAVFMSSTGSTTGYPSFLGLIVKSSVNLPEVFSFLYVASYPFFAKSCTIEAAATATVEAAVASGQPTFPSPQPGGAGREELGCLLVWGVSRASLLDTKVTEHVQLARRLAQVFFVGHFGLRGKISLLWRKYSKDNRCCR